MTENELEQKYRYLGQMQALLERVHVESDNNVDTEAFERRFICQRSQVEESIGMYVREHPDQSPADQKALFLRLNKAQADEKASFVRAPRDQQDNLMISVMKSIL